MPPDDLEAQVSAVPRRNADAGPPQSPGSTRCSVLRDVNARSEVALGCAVSVISPLLVSHCNKDLFLKIPY